MNLITKLPTLLVFAISLVGAVIPTPAADVTVDAGTLNQRIDGFGSLERVFDAPYVFNNSTRRRSARRRSSPLRSRMKCSIGSMSIRSSRAWRPVQPDSALETPEGTTAGIEAENDKADPNVIAPAQFNFSWKSNLDTLFVDGDCDWRRLWLAQPPACQACRARS